MHTYDALELDVIYLYTRPQQSRLCPISTGIDNVRNELYLSMCTYDVLELRLTR